MIVIFFTFGTRLLFSPEKISAEINQAISDISIKGVEKEDLQIEFEKAQITLLGSFSYPIGVRIKNVKIKVHFECERIEGSLKTLVIPFNLGKAYKKEIDVGLVRLSEGDFTRQNTCQAVSNVGDDKNEEATKIKIKEKSQKLNEQRLIDVLQKVADLDVSFTESEDGKRRFLGFLIYDLSFKYKEDRDFKLDRLKVLFGSGDVKAHGELTSRIIFSEAVTDLNLRADITDDLSLINLELNEKEGSVTSLIEVSRNVDSNEQVFTKASIKLKHLPLSFTSRFKDLELAGLNLRKTWLSSESKVLFYKHAINFQVKNFNIHGDFGDLNIGVNGLDARWLDDGRSQPKWRQTESVELKLSDILLSEVVALKPKKRASGVFGDFGKFNAVLTIKDFNSVDGAFETRDFSLLFRSMGRAVYQKAKSARGRVKYETGNNIDFILEEIDLVGGDFEGFIKLGYNYNEKKVYTKFEISHLKLDSKILDELFDLKLDGGGLSISGEGLAPKATFTKEDLEDEKKGNVQFILATKRVKFSNWDLENLDLNCGLDASELNCKMSPANLHFESGFAKKAELERLDYQISKTKSFSYKNKKLKLQFSDVSGGALDFDWTKEKGLVFYPEGYGQRAVRLRALD